MTYNHGLEMRKEEKRVQRMISTYRAAGVSDEMIADILESDQIQFNSDRRFSEHTQSMSVFSDDCDGTSEAKNPLQKKFIDAMSVEDTPFKEDIRDWLDSFENMALYQGIRKLSSDQKELVYCVYEEGMTFAEFARYKGVSKASVSRKHGVIIKKLKKLLENG